MILKTLKLTLPFLLLTICTTAQTAEEQYNKAVKLKTEYNYKEALIAFQKLLQTDSSNINYLTNASFCYTKAGYFFAPDAEKQGYYQKAEYLAKKAIQKNPNSADAHYTYAMALGRINENASSKQKIANAKLIKAEVDKSISLNPRLAGAFHILGRWHRTIAGFNMIEKAMINSFFGGVPPGGSYEDAVKAFISAIAIEPKAMVHQYELAVTYQEMGKDIEAKLWAKKALEITPVSPDDKKAKTDCEALLKKLE
ncbi:MAG TPA: tetratricopeptide repeat protein [Bacteroidia bacterium]|jgi:tetratricopeptide (TPR) repeat protein|nr:tetratricopeptide repeat protein [Bacteroidia bacterium]